MSGGPWFLDAFTADYLDVYRHRNDADAVREARGVLGLLRHDPARGPLLDLAAGTGRHAQAMRAARCPVVCLDLSVELSTRCAARGLPTVRGDMRALPYRDWSFAAVTMLFSSFGYFEDDEQHQAVLSEIDRVLQPGGAALLDLMDRETVRQQLVAQSVEMFDGMTVETERALVEDGVRVEKQIRLIRDTTCTRVWTESVRLFTADELGALVTRARLEVERVVGDFDARPHVPGETRWLVLLRKPR